MNGLFQKIAELYQLLVRPLVVVPIVVLICLGAVVWIVLRPDGEGVLRVDSPDQLQGFYAERGYTMQTVRRGGAKVPPVLVETVPEDWARDLDVERKKSLFFLTLLPLVLRVNDEIRADRARLEELRGKIGSGGSLSSRDRAWLLDLVIRYKVIDPDKSEAAEELSPAQLTDLHARVDIIPPSLALSQGAVESAYGLSRFAVEGNALFGQWHFGKGLIPAKQRTELGDWRIASFDTPLDSVRGYAANLNTNAAYRPFREMRARAREVEETPRGNVVVGGLLAYSERGAVYIEELRGIIRVNGLGGADSASLEDAAPVRLRFGLL